MRIAIYGAGSLGTVLGAYLAKAGIAADLIARNRAHVDALNRDGAHITGTVDFIQPVRAFTLISWKGAMISSSSWSNRPEHKRLLHN